MFANLFCVKNIKLITVIPSLSRLFVVMFERLIE